MASRSEIARQDQATEQRRNDACANIVAHTRTEQGDWPDSDHHAGLATGVLSALIEAIEAESADIAELRRKGWQSAVKAHITAAEVVKVWRDLLIGYTPPSTQALPQPAEIAVNHRAGTRAELEERLTAAFGPELAPIRHIRTTLEPTTLSEENSGTTYGNLCGKSGGSFTHPGGANCPDCHALYAEQNDGKPYDGPMAHGTELPVLAPTWSDGPITPAVAQAMREAGSFLTEAEQNEVRDLTPEELAAVQTHLRPPPEHKIGDTVTVAGIEFTKISEWPSSGLVGGQFVENNAVAMPTVIEPAARRPARERMTAAQVREHGLSRQRGAEHRSVSQVTGFADCGTRAALSDLERPAWWNVGGKAFHACAEEINRWAAVDGAAVSPTDLAEQNELWLRHFDAQIAEQCAATPDHPMDTWRAANKGSEHYDWWRVEGPVMVQRYVVWLAGMLAEGWRIATTPLGVPIVEFPMELNVGLQVPNLSIIDLALRHDAPNATPVVLIVDLKAGNSAPKDTFQLGVYGWCALSAGIAQHPTQVRGAYYRARKGEMTAPLPVLDLHPWPDVVQRYRDMDVMERQGIYLPNVTSFCGGCGVRDLCPAQPS